MSKISAVMLILTMAIMAACAFAPLDREAFLARLKARDARFDNASLQYIVGRTTRVDFHDWQFPPPPGTTPRSRGPRQLTTRSLSRLSVRGSDITFSHETIWPPFPEKIEAGTITPAMSSKFSNTSGVIREISESWPRRPGRADNLIYEVRPLDSAKDIYPEQRMAVEFALGFGYAKRIKDIAIFEAQPGGAIRIEGTLEKIWTEDKSVFQLTLDRRGIVRSAHINAWVGSALNTFDVTTSGSRRVDGMWFAGQGHFRRTLGADDGIQRTGRAAVVDEFDIEFQNAEFNLSNVRYAVLTDMNVPDGAWIIDRMSNRQYKKGGP